MRVEDTAREQGKDRYRHGDREHGQGHFAETGLGTGLGARTGTVDKGQGDKGIETADWDSGLETGGSDKNKGQKQGRTEKGREGQGPEQGVEKGDRDR